MAIIAVLSRIGGGHIAAETAEFSLAITLLALAVVVTMGRPAQMSKARVPVRRAVPPQWWPQEDDHSGLIALCLGGPIVLASAAAAIVFR
jgi:hypothetical protein